MPVDPRRFVLLALGSCLLAVGTVALLNVLADPYGSVGTGLLPVSLDQDRSRKARRAASLREPPDLVVLGSSRARLVDERRTAARTGLAIFNAAVTDGRSEDAFAFLGLLEERFPGSRPAVLWIMDLESLRARPFNPLLLNDARLARQFSPAARLRARLESVGTMVSWAPLRDSWRAARHGLGLPLPARATTGGERTGAGGRHRGRLGESIAAYRRIYQREFAALDPAGQGWFERTIAAANRRGIEPVVVLSPYHPAALRALVGAGLEERRNELRSWLATLHPRLRFTFHDMADSSTFGGTEEDFIDGVHMKRRNLDRLVDEVRRRSGGALH